MPSRHTRTQRHQFHRRVPLADAAAWERQLALQREDAQPAVRLWSTVLDEGIKDLVGRRWPQRPRLRRPEETARLGRAAGKLWEQTLRWFLRADGEDLPGTFAWICRELDLPIDAVRGDVVRATGLWPDRPARRT